MKNHCPLCNGNNIEYDSIMLEGEQIYFPFICLDCEFNGKEWYRLKYIETV